MLKYGGKHGVIKHDESFSLNFKLHLVTLHSLEWNACDQMLFQWLSDTSQAYTGCHKNATNFLRQLIFSFIPNMIAHVTTMCLEWILSFKINFTWSKSVIPIDSYDPGGYDY